MRRTYGLLWLAVLKETIYLAEEMEDNNYKESIQNLYDAAYNKINANILNGGLWNNSFYANIWKDNRVDSHVLQDQAIPCYWMLLIKTGLI